MQKILFFWKFLYYLIPCKYFSFIFTWLIKGKYFYFLGLCIPFKTNEDDLEFYIY